MSDKKPMTDKEHSAFHAKKTKKFTDLRAQLKEAQTGEKYQRDMANRADHARLEAERKFDGAAKEMLRLIESVCQKNEVIAEAQTLAAAKKVVEDAGMVCMPREPTAAMAEEYFISEAVKHGGEIPKDMVITKLCPNDLMDIYRVMVLSAAESGGG